MKAKENEMNKELIAYCGLYCGACGKNIKGKCAGMKADRSS
jgi:hypothetical protein